MPKAYHGKILRVDLSEKRWWVEELEEIIYRKYLGGGPLATYYMLREMNPGVDPLGPDNLLIFMTSVINGLPLSGANRYTAAAKSPLTNGFGESEAGGFWGPELKRSGFDGIVIHGRAAKPVYLYIHDGDCEIRDASNYWGKLSGEVQDGLEAELGDKRIRVLQTGIAGENGVLFAAMTNQLRHYHGRSGLGAVMGSKNLKAIAVRGKERLQATDGESAKCIQQAFAQSFDPETSGLHRFGTTGGVPALNNWGILPAYNFKDGTFADYEAVSGQTMTKTILANTGTCYACVVACKREVEVPERGVVPKFGGPEYEVLGAIGPLCGIGDLEAIAEASQWINQYVLDGISTGASIAFAMECYEHGILTKEDTGGIELTWGNADALIEMIHLIARREGIGDLLADGVKRAAEKLGKAAEKFALHVKGQELPMHEPRGKVAVTLSYGISPTGADHLEAPHDITYEVYSTNKHAFSQLGLLEPLKRMDFGPEKVKTFVYTQWVFNLYNAIGMCDFVGVPFGALPIENLKNYINAATGWDMSLFELLKVGERANTMARVFNVREGFTKSDDMLPARLFEPLQSGPLEGKIAYTREDYLEALDLYFSMVGWDEHGVPTLGKLAELDLSWLSD